MTTFEIIIPDSPFMQEVPKPDREKVSTDTIWIAQDDHHGTKAEKNKTNIQPRIPFPVFDSCFDGMKVSKDSLVVHLPLVSFK